MKHRTERRSVQTALVALAVLAAGCFGGDEKPRPDFMSKPAPSKTATVTPEAVTRTLPAPSSPPAVRDAELPPIPEATREPEDRSRPDDIARADEEPDSALEPDEFSDAEPDDDEFAMSDEAEANETADDVDESDDQGVDQPDDESRAPTIMLGGVPVRVPRPLPVDDLPDATSAPAAEPTPSQVARATERWKPKPQSEIDRLLERERGADLSDVDVQQMPNYFEIPAPPNPDPDAD